MVREGGLVKKIILSGGGDTGKIISKWRKKEERAYDSQIVFLNSITRRCEYGFA